MFSLPLIILSFLDNIFVFEQIVNRHSHCVPPERLTFWVTYWVTERMNSVYIADHDWHQWGLTFWLNGKLILGSLSNYEDNVNVRKQMVLWSKQQLCTCITLFSTFLKMTSSAPLRRETSQCDVFNRTWTYDDKFSFSLFEHVDK